MGPTLGLFEALNRTQPVIHCRSCTLEHCKRVPPHGYFSSPFQKRHATTGGDTRARQSTRMKGTSTMLSTQAAIVPHTLPTCHGSERGRGLLSRNRQRLVSTRLEIAFTPWPRAVLPTVRPRQRAAGRDSANMVACLNLCFPHFDCLETSIAAFPVLPAALPVPVPLFQAISMALGRSPSTS